MGKALEWAKAYRKSILAVAVVALPLVSRYVPGFPSDEILKVLGAILGA
ncbi:hypothetical protein RKD49_005388 [Streptomyces glaucescens]